MRPDLQHFAAAPREAATLGYWLASQMAPLVNAAPKHAEMALQTLAVIAAARPDRIGDRAAARFFGVTGREIERIAAPPR